MKLCHETRIVRYARAVDFVGTLRMILRSGQDFVRSAIKTKLLAKIILQIIVCSAVIASCDKLTELINYDTLFRWN